jgi:VWFA-related protein
LNHGILDHPYRVGRMTMDRLKHTAIIIVFTLALSGVVLPGAFAQGNIRLNIDSVYSEDFPDVQAYVSVSNPQGFPVENLSEQNFTLSEGGNSITTFEVAPNQSDQQPLAFALVLDTSGSMDSLEPGEDVKPIENAVSAAKDFLAALENQDFVGIVTFSDEVSTIQELTTDKGLASSALDSVVTGTNTALYDGIVGGIDLLKNRAERRAMILLTDGIDSWISEYELSEALDEAARWSVPVYPIGFGAVNQEELEHIAELTGGAAQIKPDSTELQSAFNTILEILRDQYMISFDSSLQADGKEHELVVAVNHQAWFGETSRHFIAHPGEITITFPDLKDGQVVGGKVFFNPEILAPGTPEQMEILIDGQPLTTEHGDNLGYEWESTTVSEGGYEFTFTVQDSAGNLGETSLRLNVRPPVVLTITTPLEGEEVVLGTTISTEISSLDKLARVEVEIDGKVIDLMDNPPEQEFTYDARWNTFNVEPGLRKIWVRAFDVNGYSDEMLVKVIVAEGPLWGGNIWVVAFAVALAVLILVLILGLRARRHRMKAAAPVPSMAPTGGGGGLLRELEGINPDQVWPLAGDEVRLGRKRDENDIHLSGRGASRRQAVIRSHMGAHILYNLKVENPIILNGMPVQQQHTLQPGDIIQAGDSVFRYEV